MIVVLEFFEEWLGFLLFDLAAGLARYGNKSLGFGLFSFPDMLSDDILLDNTGESACHNIQIQTRWHEIRKKNKAD